MLASAPEPHRSSADICLRRDDEMLGSMLDDRVTGPVTRCSMLAHGTHTALPCSVGFSLLFSRRHAPFNCSSTFLSTSTRRSTTTATHKPMTHSMSTGHTGTHTYSFTHFAFVYHDAPVCPCDEGESQYRSHTTRQICGALDVLLKAFRTEPAAEKRLGLSLNKALVMEKHSKSVPANSAVARSKGFHLAHGPRW